MKHFQDDNWFRKVLEGFDYKSHKPSEIEVMFV